MPGITWEDVRASDVPALRGLIARGAVANVSVRPSNRAGEAYGALGAGQRTHAGPDAGWAFNRDEVVAGGPATELARRRSGDVPEGYVLVATIGELREVNAESGFDARLGLLAALLAERGRRAAVVGNADLAGGALPDELPSPERMEEPDPPDPGIHREAALAAMTPGGGVAAGNVSRALLRPEPGAPFGVATDPAALLAAFREAWATSDLVVVESGDTARADAAALGLSEAERAAARRRGVERADLVLSGLLAEVEGDRTLVVVLAPTTPGGIGQRGQLRPAVVAGPGIFHGVMTSPSTRRGGLVTVADLSALVARHLMLAPEGFEAGRPPLVEPGGSDPLGALVDRNRRAVVHDRLRAPVSVVVLGMEVAFFATAVAVLRRRPLPRWLAFPLLGTLAFPLGSFASTAWVWRAGVLPAAVTVMAATVLLAAAALGAARGSAARASTLLLGGMFLFFCADLLAGAPAQLDSVFGYTSVAGGRFFGLGNLAFALLASSALLLAGVLWDRPRSRPAALAVLAGAVVAVGLPALGADVGGTLTTVPAAAFLVLRGTGGGRLTARRVLLAVAAAALAVLAFGGLDLSRPAAERTHLGRFLVTAASDPGEAFTIVRRKAEIAVVLAVSTKWGLVAPAGAAVLVWLHRRSRDRWRDLMRERPGTRAGLAATVLAAVVGSVVNDSGVAVAGMMLAVAAPWALLAASEGMHGPGE